MKRLLLPFFCFFILVNCSKNSSGIDDESLDVQYDESVTNPSPDSTIDPSDIPNDIWWNDEVFYEIFVRSFNDSDGNGIGDIQGIIDKLDYLNDGNPATTTDLGITGLWLMPIFPSPSYHGYDVTDYRDINSDYGTLEDFRRLLTEAHSRGIKIIIDFVGNHTSDQHQWFTQSASGQSKRDWYLWEQSNPNFNGPWGQTVWHQRNNAYYYGLFWGGMPDLNFHNDEVTQEIKDISQFWAEIGVDGFRIDAVKHWVEEGSNQENTQSTLDWWRNYYAFQKSLSPSFMTVGEVWTSTQNILPYSDKRLDYCF
jgi:alpha-amylase